MEMSLVLFIINFKKIIKFEYEELIRIISFKFFKEEFYY